MKVRQFIFNLFKDLIIKHTIQVNPNYIVKIIEQKYDLIKLRSEFVITWFDKTTYGMDEVSLHQFIDYNRRKSISQISSEIAQYVSISKLTNHPDNSDHYELSILIAKEK